MLWCQGAESIGLSNHKLKTALTAPYDHNACPSQTDRQTHEHLTNASRAKNCDESCLNLSGLWNRSNCINSQTTVEIRRLIGVSFNVD